MDERLLITHLFSGGVQRFFKINRKDGKRMGCNGDCRDCLYYRDFYDQTRQDE